MVKTSFRIANVVVALSAIFITWGCTVTHKELRTYRSVKHLSVSQVVDMASETMRQMSYRTSDEYGNGHLFGIKLIGFRRFEMNVNVGSDAQMDKFLNVKCHVITNRVETISSLAEKGNIEVQKFHELFGALAKQSGLSTGEAQKTEPVSTSPPEQQPKGFE